MARALVIGPGAAEGTITNTSHKLTAHDDVARRNHLPCVRTPWSQPRCKLTGRSRSGLPRFPGIGRLSSPRADDRYFCFAADSSLIDIWSYAGHLVFSPRSDFVNLNAPLCRFRTKCVEMM
jgi:hypothetical protein